VASSECGRAEPVSSEGGSEAAIPGAWSLDERAATPKSDVEPLG
jgi:hypothetical protein